MYDMYMSPPVFPLFPLSFHSSLPETFPTPLFFPFFRAPSGFMKYLENPTRALVPVPASLHHRDISKLAVRVTLATPRSPKDFSLNSLRIYFIPYLYEGNKIPCVILEKNLDPKFDLKSSPREALI